DAFRDLRYCISSGAPLGRKVHEDFRARFGVSVCSYYGSNEAMGVSIDLEDDFEEGRVGHPFNGVTIGIFDEKGTRCPPETSGQIGIRTAAIFDGYVGDPGMTARAIRDGYFFPGDAGFLD
ncbi:MAG: AMP-binding protein, partial [Alphaproteobacteria bacterium]